MPKAIIDARPIQPKEIGVAVNFFVNPSKLRVMGERDKIDLDTFIEQLVDQQFDLARPQLVNAIKEYVGTEQTLIDKTRT